MLTFQVSSYVVFVFYTFHLFLTIENYSIAITPDKNYGISTLTESSLTILINYNGMPIQLGF